MSPTPIGTALVLLAVFSGCAGQETAPQVTGGGAEARVYPAGVIPTVHVLLPDPLAGFGGGEPDPDDPQAASPSGEPDHGVARFSVGYNFTDREDFGEHDDETGGGPGIGFGYRHYLDAAHRGLYVGGQLDLWDLEIDWVDDRGAANERRGSTDILVLQPTVAAGYGFALTDNLTLDLGLAFGIEVNVETDGEDVGEGAILLGGLSLNYSF